MSVRKKIAKEKASQTTLDPETGEAREAAESASAGFPIVSIGASAGGLAAFEAFFSGMPKDADPGMAFVLAQHLVPDHKSILTDLIRRYTRMQVFEVEDGMAVQPNCAYIIPPNRDMAFLNGALQLLESSAPRGQRHRPGGLRTAPGRDTRPAHRLRGPRLRQLADKTLPENKGGPQ